MFSKTPQKDKVLVPKPSEVIKTGKIVKINEEKKSSAISINKALFMNMHPIKRGSAKQLTTKSLDILKKFYENKHHIKIIINGDTDYGKKQIVENQKPMRKEFKEFSDEKFIYANYLIEHWCEEGSSRGGDLNNFDISNELDSHFEKYYAEMKFYIINFLDKDGEIRKNLTHQEKLELSEIARFRFSLITRSEFNILDAKIAEYQHFLQNKINNIGLDKLQAVNEINLIQKSMHDDEIVGYIFTNNAKSEAAHFETVIITKTEIIKPMNFNVYSEKALEASDFDPNFYVANFSENNHTLINKEINALMLLKVARQFMPQADIVSCGILSLLYLKELLKNNARQLKESTLRVAYYAGNELYHLFIPSPHVLRYSQSDLYNKLVSALFEDKQVSEVIHKDATYKINTLQKLLTDSIAIATKKGRKDIANANRKLLAALPAFAKKWQQEFAINTKKRDTMYDPKDKLNLYLEYSNIRLHKKCSLLAKSVPQNKSVSFKQSF